MAMLGLSFGGGPALRKCVAGMCTCTASVHGDFLDDAVQHCQLVQPIVQAAWAIISVMGVVVTVAGLQRVRHYIRKQHQLKLQVSWRSDPVFRLLILLSFVGCGYAVLATLKLFDPDAAIGASLSATCVYCTCFTLFPAFAFQLIWSWVQVACSSALGQQHEMEVLLRKLKLGFCATSAIVLASAWAPVAMLLPNTHDGKVRTRFHFVANVLRTPCSALHVADDAVRVTLCGIRSREFVSDCVHQRVWNKNRATAAAKRIVPKNCRPSSAITSGDAFHAGSACFPCHRSWECLVLRGDCGCAMASGAIQLHPAPHRKQRAGNVYGFDAHVQILECLIDGSCSGFLTSVSLTISDIFLRNRYTHRKHQLGRAGPVTKRKLSYTDRSKLGESWRLALSLPPQVGTRVFRQLAPGRHRGRTRR